MDNCIVQLKKIRGTKKIRKYKQSHICTEIDESGARNWEAGKRGRENLWCVVVVS